MIVDLPGRLVPFTDVNSGQLFIHFAGGEADLGMKIHNAASPTSVAVLSFALRPHPSVQGPSIVDPSQFMNRDVAVLQEAVVRPVYDLTALREGSPSLDDHGAIIFVAGTALIRAYGRHGSMDIDLVSGAAQNARNHPGSMWVNQWEVVLPRPSGQTKLFERER